MDNNFTANKAVISLSGGLDSTSLLMTLLAEGKEVRAYSFNYGQKHDVELKKVQNNIKFLQKKGLPVTHQIIDLRDVFSDNTSALVASTGKEIPEGYYNEESMKSTVVPLRNCIFSAIIYSKAINWAVASDENVYITLGIHGGDHFIYLDCRPESQEACEKAYKISDENSYRVEYIAPFIHIDKGDVLAEGIKAMKELNFTEEEIDYVLANTHTCYNPDSEGRSCGRCGSCTERLEAFEKVGRKDPIQYQ